MTTAPMITINLDGMTFAQAQKELEAAYMGHILTATRFNQAKAAKLAGMSYNAFRERVSRLNLRVAAA